jgi:hypothetical protein
MTATKDPTPEEIAQRCAEIQRGWSEQERMKRLRSDLRPSFVGCDGVAEEMSAANYEGHHDARAAILDTMADP